MPVRTMLVADASRRTRKHNAYVSGLGPDAAARALRHAARGRAAGRSCAASSRTSSGTGASGTWRAGRRSRWLGAAAAVLSCGALLCVGRPRRGGQARGPATRGRCRSSCSRSWLLELGALPFETWLSRSWERAADRFALELTGDAGTMEQMHRRLALANLADLDPPRPVYLLLFTHPTPPERIAAARMGTMSHSHDHTSARRPLAIALGADPRPDGGRGRLRRSSPARSRCSPTPGHMLTDAAALALALGALSLAGRPARGRWTFGFRRLEILAAHVNGITLLVVGVVIVYTAVRRLVDPPDVRGGRRARRRARRDRRQPRRGRAARTVRAARA